MIVVTNECIVTELIRICYTCLSVWINIAQCKSDVIFIQLIIRTKDIHCQKHIQIFTYIQPLNSFTMYDKLESVEIIQ